MFNLYKHQRIAVMTAVITVMAVVALLLPVSMVSAANVSVSVCLFESNDTTPLSGASVSYYQNGGWRSFGSTDSSGCVSRSDIDSSINNFSISYLYTSLNKTQDISAGGQQVRFNTTPAAVKLTNSAGTGLSGGAVSYYAYGGWRNLGTTDANGIAQREILPGSYAFTMSYLYASNQSAAVDISLASGADPDYTFSTTPAVVKLANSAGTGLSGGAVSYYSYGGWRTLATTDANGIAQLEILPGSYAFTMSYLYASNQSAAVNIGTGNDASVDYAFSTTPAVVKLADSNGVALSGGAVSYYSYGGWRTLGTTGADGIAQLEILPGVYSFTMSYLYTSNQSPATDIGTGNNPAVDYTFNTTPAVAKLATCAGVGLEGGVISYYAYGGWRSLGTTGADGIAQREILPGSYPLSITYRYVTNQSAAVDVLTAAGSAPDKTFTTTTVTMNSNQNISYYAYGGWRTFSKPTMELLPETYHFRAGDHDFYLTVSGCSVIGGGNLVLVKLFNGDELLTAPHKLECSGVAYLDSGVYFTNKSSWTCRGRFNGIAGPWFTFNTLNTILDYEFATVGVTLYNDTADDGTGPEDLLTAPHKVEVSGVGYFTTGETFHVPAGANLSYRLRRNGIAGPWQQISFAAGDTAWALEFATVHVSLFDASDALLGDPHKVEVSGVGYYTSGDTFHVPPGANLSYRLRRNGIAGPWQQISFVAGETDWSLDFATVSVSLFDASDALLYDPHKVEVSGVGYYTSNDTFNVPPGANLSFRLRRNGIAGPWQQISFAAGATSWSLDFATVSVTLYNDEDGNGIDPADLLYDPHKVEVSGVGYYTSGDIFNVPPDANLSFRLRRNGIAGPWQQRVFAVGATTWELEFATVEVQIELPADVASLTKIEVSGVGYYADEEVFDVPPGARLTFRLRNNGWAGPWYSTDDTGAFLAGEGHLIWGLSPRYEAAP